MKKNKNRYSDPLSKRLEYKLKGFFSQFLSNKVAPINIKSPETVFNFSKNDKILILRQDRLGDLIISTSFIRNLKKIFPNCQVDIILSEKNFSGKRAIEKYINKFYLYKKDLLSVIKLIFKLRKNKYSLIIDLFDNPSTTSSLLIKFIKPKYSLGLDKSNSMSYTHTVPLLDKHTFHIVDRIFNLFLAFGDIPPTGERNLEFDITDNERISAIQNIGKSEGESLLGINLAGSQKSRYWGLNNYIELIKKINNQYPKLKIVIFSTTDYARETDEIIKYTNSIASPRTDSFIEYASYISVCDYLISPDTSATHLASAFQIPCISLSLWQSNKEMGMPWGNYNSRGIMLFTKTNMLSDIKVDEVFSAFMELAEI